MSKALNAGTGTAAFEPFSDRAGREPFAEAGPAALEDRDGYDERTIVFRP